MKRILVVPMLTASLFLSACQSTKVSYFVEPMQDMRVSTRNAENTSSGGSGVLVGILLAVAAVALVQKSTCRPGAWQPAYGGAYWDPGTC